jgi:hypothetical protein
LYNTLNQLFIFTFTHCFAPFALLPGKRRSSICTDQSVCAIGSGEILRPDGSKRNVLVGSGIKSSALNHYGYFASISSTGHYTVKARLALPLEGAFLQRILEVG